MSDTDRHPSTRQADALRDALKARRRSESTDYPGVPAPALTRPQLEGLAQTLESWHAHAVTVAAKAPDQALVNYPRLDAMQTAARLARDAARYGYPRPPLEQLGAQAAHLPTARTTDPHTSHDAGAEVSGRPSTRNQLGRLLVAFRVFERVPLEAQDPTRDRTMTSEEAARFATISPTSEYAKRCSDLTTLGYIRVAQDADGHDRTRKGRAGMQRLVFELTDDGRRLADDLIVRRG